MKKFAGQWNLNGQDFVRGLVMAVLGAVGAVIQNSLASGQFTLDWSNIWHVAAIAGLGYLMKQFATPIPKVVEVDPTKTTVLNTQTKEVITDPNAVKP